MSLMDMVKGQLTQAVLGKLGEMLGESPEKTTAGVNAAVPTILHGLINKASTSDGANWLGKELDNHDGGILDNLGGLMNPSQSKGIADKGVGLLGSLMGNGMSGNVIGLISKVSGLGSGSSRSMMGMLMPIVMGVLGKHSKSSGMDVGSLVGFLNEQKSSVSAALPAGLNDLYASGASSAPAAAAHTASAAPAATARSSNFQPAPVANSGGGGLGWLTKLLPVALVAILGYFGWNSLSGGGAPDVSGGIGAVADGVGGGLGAVADGAGSIAGGVADGVGAAASGVGAAASSVTDGVGSAAATLGDGVGGLQDAAAGAMNFDFKNPLSVVSGLPGMLDGAKETFGGITDVESAKSALPKIEGMSTAFEGLGTNLGALPEAAQGTIKEQVGGFIPTIQAMVDKVMAIPGVGDVLGPTIEGLMEKLAVFGG